MSYYFFILAGVSRSEFFIVSTFFFFLEYIKSSRSEMHIMSYYLELLLLTPISL